MYAFVVLVGLGLGLGVAMGVLDELVPVKTPKALTRTVGALIGIGISWGLDYSMFAAFGQELREQWMHYVATGIVLVAFADVCRTAAEWIGGMSRKAHDEAATLEARIPRAA